MPHYFLGLRWPQMRHSSFPIPVHEVSDFSSEVVLSPQSTRTPILSLTFASQPTPCDAAAIDASQRSYVLQLHDHVSETVRHTRSRDIYDTPHKFYAMDYAQCGRALGGRRTGTRF